MATFADYHIVYSGGMSPGTVPASKTFRQLGIVAAKFEAVAGGEDSAELTVDATVWEEGMPVVPLGRHDIYAPGIAQPVFTGWLMEPGRRAAGSQHQQTFKLEGPACRLKGIPLQAGWKFADDPTSASSTLTPLPLGRVILNLDGDGNKVEVRDQLASILAYASAQGAPVLCGGLGDVPDCQPMEDVQTDINCWSALLRTLRNVPIATAYWRYSATNATMHFSAGDGGSGTVTVDLKSGLIEDFKSDPLYKLLVRKVTINLLGEQTATADDGTSVTWATLTTQTSGPVDNGSFADIVLTCQLRPAGNGVVAEIPPTGLAEALHAPFKELTHAVSWRRTTAAPDWTATPGMAVQVLNAGDAGLAGARSVIQRITRTVTNAACFAAYEAGPAKHLGLSDLMALNRMGRTLNEAITPNSAGVPGMQQFGFAPQQDEDDGTGGALGPVLFVGTASGALAYFKVNADHTAYSTPPAGIPIANPP